MTDYLSRLHDLDPGKKGEHEEENHGEHLPAGQHLLRLLAKLEVNQEYRHLQSSQRTGLPVKLGSNHSIQQAKVLGRENYVFLQIECPVSTLTNRY